MQYFAIPGLTLPDYAHPELAFLQTTPITKLNSGTITLDEPPATYIDVLLQVSATITSTVGTGDRVASIDCFSSSANIIYTLGLTPWVQPPSTIGQYVFSTDFGSAVFTSSSTTTFVQAPLVMLPIMPTFKVTMSGAFTTKGDAWSGVTATVLRIPTGPVGSGADLAAAALAPIAAPLLV